MTVKHVSKSTNPTLGTYSKLHIKVCLEALKVDLMALKVTKGEGVLFLAIPRNLLAWEPAIPGAVPEVCEDVQPGSLHGAGNRRIIRKWHISDEKVTGISKGFFHRKSENVWKQMLRTCSGINGIFSKELQQPEGLRPDSASRLQVCEWKWCDACSFYACRLGSTLTCWPGINCSIYTNAYKEM